MVHRREVAGGDAARCRKQRMFMMPISAKPTTPEPQTCLTGLCFYLYGVPRTPTDSCTSILVLARSPPANKEAAWPTLETSQANGKRQRSTGTRAAAPARSPLPHLTATHGPVFVPSRASYSYIPYTPLRHVSSSGSQERQLLKTQRQEMEGKSFDEYHGEGTSLPFVR